MTNEKYKVNATNLGSHNDPVPKLTVKHRFYVHLTHTHAHTL